MLTTRPPKPSTSVINYHSTLRGSPKEHRYHLQSVAIRNSRKLLGSFTCRKAGTWDRFFYFPSGRRHAEDFYVRKIQRLRPGLKPRIWVPEASMLTTRPPKPSTSVINYHSTLRGTPKERRYHLQRSLKSRIVIYIEITIVAIFLLYLLFKVPLFCVQIIRTRLGAETCCT